MKHKIDYKARVKDYLEAVKQSTSLTEIARMMPEGYNTQSGDFIKIRGVAEALALVAENKKIGFRFYMELTKKGIKVLNGELELKELGVR